MGRRNLTPFGRTVKKKLIDKGMTQAEFCRRYKLNRHMFCDMLHSDERYMSMRRLTAALLELDKWRIK